MKPITYKCSRCGKAVVREWLDEEMEWEALNRSVLTLRVNEAPRVRCCCGQLTILIKGSMS